VTSVYLHASPTTMRAAVEKLRFGASQDEQQLPQPAPLSPTHVPMPVASAYSI
jgi:hypothetical protein